MSPSVRWSVLILALGIWISFVVADLARTPDHGQGEEDGEGEKAKNSYEKDDESEEIESESRKDDEEYDHDRHYQRIERFVDDFVWDAEEEYMMSPKDEAEHLREAEEEEEYMRGLEGEEEYTMGLKEEEGYMRDLDVEEDYMRGLDVEEDYMRGLDVKEDYMRGLDVEEDYMRGLDVEEDYMRGLDVAEDYMRRLDVAEDYMRDLDVAEDYMRDLDAEEDYMRGLDAEENSMRDLDTEEDYMRDLEEEKEYMRDLDAEEDYMRDLDAEEVYSGGIVSNEDELTGDPQRAKSGDLLTSSEAEIELDEDLLEEEMEQKRLHGSERTQDSGSGREEVGESAESQQLEKLMEQGRKLLDDGEDIAGAMKKLEEAAGRGHDGAIGTLGALYISGYEPQLGPDVKKGLKLLRRAALMGNADAMALIGTLYASGWAGGLEANTAKAILYWTVAARGGSAPAQMAMGYRYLYGIDVEENCDRAAYTYLQAAGQAIAEVNTHDVFVAMIEDVRLDNVPEMRKRSQQVEVVQYYKHSAERGDVSQQLALGQLHLFGAPGLPQDFGRARELFMRAAEAHDPRAHAFLGFMYYRGVGVEQDNSTAWNHFKISSMSDEPAGLHGVGVAYRFGAGVEQDYSLAVHYFQKAAEKHHAEAMYSLGTMYLEGLGVEQSDAKALEQFKQAARENHLHAMYQVGEMMRNDDHGVAKDCALASQHLKQVAEMWFGGMYTTEAFESYEDGDYAVTLYRYIQAAHLGVEIAQFNAAYLLERRMGTESFANVDEDLLALELYKQSARQGNIESELKVGDILYDKVHDYEGAVAVYQRAKDQSSEALFNLGLMHVIGRGLPVDLHLAKRYFDQSKAGSDEAFLPALIALHALRVYCRWNVYIDPMLAWILSTVNSVTGNNLSLGTASTAREAEAGDASDEHDVALSWTEYSDLVLITVLLGALLLVIVTRQRRLGRGVAALAAHRNDQNAPRPPNDIMPPGMMAVDGQLRQ